MNGDEQPAVLVSWFDAQAFCEWLNTYFRHSMPTGMRCRLPTHAEWITVARCGRQRRYPWGNDWPPQYGNHADQATLSAFPDIKGIEGYDEANWVLIDYGNVVIHIFTDESRQYYDLEQLWCEAKNVPFVPSSPESLSA